MPQQPHDHDQDDQDDTDSLYSLAFSGREDNDDDGASDDEWDDDDASGDSDVFEDDIESLVLLEQERERALGVDSCFVEERSASLRAVELALPQYLFKLPELLPEDAVFGRDPVHFVSCTNLQYKPEQFAALEVQRLAYEARKLEDVKRLATQREQERKAQEEERYA